ncbi:alpha-amylase family glycosyl hydrolase [Pseudokineococcus lusitanus]|uniref:Maltose alpha-D-glucosyltransferase/alpha-amylase n=1 Tax=Pseudokineococcus lusitanus TaxID=763993 RepID=A0A3N1HQF1_9ACTN|nr:alpha-amylase family glycosyl hydrolase [Pseudokineococcus lusitanus]ROP44744.1 maltose alpha-D-glucosyltransferase/alpha-amylase [Pseudokineococcus lusitanus]
MRLTTTADQWWTTGIGYCLDVARFACSTGDGHGDLVGLGRRIDHLERLGVGFVWLQPFYPSPEGDDGYDISDYYAVAEDVGTLGDLVEVVRALRERGIRVLVDLVVNHTSDTHPWFRAARADKGSRYRDWYVWRDEPDPADADAQNVFPDAEDSVWSYDEEAGQHYRHRFYGHQPDLNTSNAEVRDEILKIMGFWLQLGVAGFRVDAVPFFVETAARDGDADDAGAPDGEDEADGGQGGEGGEHLGESMQMLDVMREFLARRSSEALMLGEVNLPYEQQQEFFGDLGDRMTINFDFPLNQALYLSLARGSSAPLRGTLESRPVLPEGKAYGVFARNHDELTLDQLSDDERAEVMAAFGPREDQQLFGRGLRLRLPTMLDGDLDRLEMVYSLVFSVPGTPVLYYGEEVAQREDLSAPGRVAVRTPLDWGDGEAGVAAQDADPASMLHRMRRLTTLYKQRPELGRGALRLVDVGDERVLAHTCTWDGRTTLALANLGDEPVEVRVPGGLLAGRVTELFSAEPVAAPEEGIAVTLPRYGRAWYAEHR